MEGCHNDSNPANNHLSNLRWDTRSANRADTVRAGNHAQARKTHCPQGHDFDVLVPRAWGTERRCSRCTSMQRRARTKARRESTRTEVS
jgi:hypothetical protein